MTAFIRATAIRATKTFAQTATALIPATAIGLGGVDWVLTASSAGLAAVLSILTSVATGLPEAGPVEVAIVPPEG